MYSTYSRAEYAVDHGHDMYVGLRFNTVYKCLAYVA